MAIRSVIMLMIVTFNFLSIYAEEEKIEPIKISENKVYGPLEVRLFYPRGYDESKLYPLLFTNVKQNTGHVDHAVWTKFAEEGFIVAQLVSIKDEKNLVLKWAEIFKTMAKDIQIDITNVFGLGFSAMGNAIMQEALKEPAAFRGVVSVCHICDAPNLDKDNGKLLMLVITGDKDYNYKPIQMVSKKFISRKFQFTLKEVNGLEHLFRLTEAPVVIEWCQKNLKKTKSNVKK